MGGGEISAQATAARVYQVSCTATSGLKTLAQVRALALAPGDSVLLQRGCTFDGPLQTQASGTSTARITYGAYGTGTNPVIRITAENSAVQARGSWVTFQDIDLVASGARSIGGTGRCAATPVGWFVGWEVHGRYNILQRVSARGFMTGAMLVGTPAGATTPYGYHKVLGSRFTDNKVMKTVTVGGDDDSGAWGVLVNSSNNEIASNQFTGHSACSEDYIRDGSSVELFEASSNWVHHNSAREDVGFVELGGSATSMSQNNRIEDNVYGPVLTGGAFVTLRGPGSGWGANPGTRVLRNTSYKADLGIICSDGCSPTILVAEDNKIWERQTSTGLAHHTVAMWGDAAFTEGRNTFWRDDGRPNATIDNALLNITDKTAYFAPPAGF